MTNNDLQKQFGIPSRPAPDDPPPTPTTVPDPLSQITVTKPAPGPRRFVATVEPDPALREIADHVFGDTRRPAPTTTNNDDPMDPELGDFVRQLFNKEN